MTGTKWEDVRGIKKKAAREKRTGRRHGDGVHVPCPSPVPCPLSLSHGARSWSAHAPIAGGGGPLPVIVDSGTAHCNFGEVWLANGTRCPPTSSHSPISSEIIEIFPPASDCQSAPVCQSYCVPLVLSYLTLVCTLYLLVSLSFQSPSAKVQGPPPDTSQGKNRLK